MTVVAWLALVLFAELMFALVCLHRVREAHHGYWGAALVLLAALLAMPAWLALALSWIGALLLLDDDVQHVAEAMGLVPRLADFTPIHRVGSWLVGLDWTRVWSRAGWWAPLAVIAVLAACAIVAALHGWGV